MLLSRTNHGLHERSEVLPTVPLALDTGFCSEVPILRARACLSTAYYQHQFAYSDARRATREQFFSLNDLNYTLCNKEQYSIVHDRYCLVETMRH